jgi:hypothetical protein
MITQMDHPASFIHKVTGEIKARNKWDLESERERERAKNVRGWVLRIRGCSISHKFFCW